MKQKSDIKHTSIWLDNLNYVEGPSLEKDISVDVLIIGGGITGLSIAYELIDTNLKVCLVEANKIAHGVTAKTTGKLTYLQENVYSSLNNMYGLNIASDYLNSQKLAIKHIKEIIKKEGIDCNFENVDSYLFTNNEVFIKNVQNEQEVLNKMNIKTKKVSKLPDGKSILYGFSVKNTAVFHPLKYLISLKKIIETHGIKIYEKTRILKISKDNDFVCQTGNFTIRAKKVVMATHYPYFLIPYLMPLKVHLEKSYIAAYKVEKNDFFSGITVKNPTTSIRYYEDKDIYKIYLNGSHNLASNYNNNQNFVNLLTSFGLNPEYIWSNKDIITFDKMPLIGEIDNGMFLATGYNTWGMTNGVLSGLIIKNLILQREGLYNKTFAPDRVVKNKLISYPINIYSSAASFAKTKINKNKKWYSNRVYFTKGLGIYIDNDNKEHIVYNKCPHLKCSLIFNEVEKTWDCPCHGSRFDVDGNVIEGPSNYNICFKKQK